jgi:putative transposase
MQYVEQHVISRGDPRFALLDDAAFRAKNLYNAALYEIRQAFINDGCYLNYNEMQRRMKGHEAYKALPAKVSQQLLMVLERNWTAFFEGCKAYQEDASAFLGRPHLPKYKHKTKGRAILIYTRQAIGRGKRSLDRGIIAPSGLALRLKTRQQPETIRHVRIVPKNGYYVVEVVYEQDERKTAVDPMLVAGIDLGLNNLAALTSNKSGFVPVLVNGRGLKATNQFYNKRKAILQKKAGNTATTARMERLTNKRNRRMEHDLHTISRFLIDLLVSEGIGTLVIGKNDGWKQEANLGPRTNQHFVQIPHARFIEMVMYKAARVGICVTLTEESYTSQASFLDGDPLPVYGKVKNEKPTFSGKRIKRGLYRASDGRLINADINGASNIVRKVAPNAFGSEGVEDGKGHPLVVHPVRIVIPLTNPKTLVVSENARV